LPVPGTHGSPSQIEDHKGRPSTGKPLLNKNDGGQTIPCPKSLQADQAEEDGQTRVNDNRLCSAPPGFAIAQGPRMRPTSDVKVFRARGNSGQSWPITPGATAVVRPRGLTKTRLGGRDSGAGTTHRSPWMYDDAAALCAEWYTYGRGVAIVIRAGVPKVLFRPPPGIRLLCASCVDCLILVSSCLPQADYY
jgi:hypothetical protein